MKRVPKLNGMAHRIALGLLDSRLLAEAIELDHPQIGRPSRRRIICHRGIRIHIVPLRGQPFIFARSRKL